mmetsp:Transcript_31490/g.79271  ORF Transcript_31490/g.79271 Transcript_31490/m.79271 type:complete len:217 (-) Transcript_31490:8-658(-)
MAEIWWLTSSWRSWMKLCTGLTAFCRLRTISSTTGWAPCLSSTSTFSRFFCRCSNSCRYTSPSNEVSSEGWFCSFSRNDTILSHRLWPSSTMRCSLSVSGSIAAMSGAGGSSGRCPGVLSGRSSLPTIICTKGMLGIASTTASGSSSPGSAIVVSLHAEWSPPSLPPSSKLRQLGLSIPILGGIPCHDAGSCSAPVSQMIITSHPATRPHRIAPTI